MVKQNNDGILYLFKKNKVTFFHGRGAFAGAAKDGVYQIDVSDPSSTSIGARQVIIATGSNARALPGVAFDEKLVLSNDGALRIGETPKKLGVIGAGVIGLRWARCGAAWAQKSPCSKACRISLAPSTSRSPKGGQAVQKRDSPFTSASRSVGEDWQTGCQR